MHANRLTTAAAVRLFALAGNATLTLVSRESGRRFTYRIRKGKEEKAPHFVSLLNGPQNESDYRFLGTIFGGQDYRHGRKSSVGMEAPSARAFAWMWRYVVCDVELPDKLEVWHEGRCGRCGRKLTVPASIELGIGPECADKLGVKLGAGYDPHNSGESRQRWLSL